MYYIANVLKYFILKPYFKNNRSNSEITRKGCSTNCI